MIGAEFALSNKETLESELGHKVGSTELYLAHFLGAGGASRFVKAIERNANQPAADLLPLVQPGQALFPLMTLAGGKYCAMGGGAPLSSEGKVVAGVGVSGGTVEQDVAILESALQEQIEIGK